MGKPSDKQDSTQPLSSSQIVTVTPASPATIDRNDRSVWRQVVVGADDFAVAPVKRKRTGLVVAILILLAGGIGAAAYYVMRSPSASVVAVDAAIVPDAAVPMSVAPADAAVVVDAPADAPADAAVDAPEDAGVPVDAAVPVKKPPPKKPPPKKPPPKRKPR
jgi:hypothetical protein